MGMFLSLTINGIAMGMVYALLGLGLVLLLRAVGVTNFAQGDLLVIGAYLSHFAVVQLQLSPLLSILLVTLAFIAIGIIFMFTCYWPVRKNKWGQATLVCTLGASMAIPDLCMVIFGTQIKTMPKISDGSITIAGVSISHQYLFIIGICILIVIGIFLLFDKLYVGKVMSAASQQKYAAQLIGIPVTLTIMATYIIVMIVAGVAGWLVAPLFLVRSSLSTLQLKAFAGVVLGGLGNLKGAIVGSLIIGLLEAYSTYFTLNYMDAFVFLVLLLVLLIRPQGIFGAYAVSEKA